MLRAASLLVLLVIVAGPAGASSSQWHANEGAAIRLVTAGEPDAQGRLRGALEIDLDRGWKTYWRDPGEAGIPPRIDISRSTNVVSADIAFPAPERIDDGYARWAGYTASVALPVTFQLSPPDAVAVIEADVLLGVCETICIPVHANFAFDPGADPHAAGDVAVVEAAHAALPATAGTEFGVSAVRRDNKTLIVETAIPSGTRSAELFIAGDESLALSTPEGVERGDGAASFAVDLLEEAGQGASVLPSFDYTLVADGKAVSGKLPVQGLSDSD